MAKPQRPASPAPSPSPPTAGRAGSIFSPAVDLLLVGGLSLLVFIPLLLSGRKDLVLVGAGTQALLAGIINMPHFMASYRLVYRDRASILRHRWASIYVPAILLAYIVFALSQAAASPVHGIILVSVGSAYLAWHYTGQTWGMMASYAWLGGRSFDQTERRLIRSGLRILLAWHVTWFFYQQMRDPGRIQPIDLALTAATGLAFLLGLAGFVRARRRTGLWPTARVIVPWLSIFAWYAMMARDPKAIFWVQIAHAVQYLAFPVRVEVNRTVAGQRSSSLPLWGHMLLYAVGLMAASLVVGLVVPGRAMDIIGNVFGEEGGRAAPILVLIFINIHHYFTDGVIWKISNPEVRRELFAHVGAPSPAAPTR